MKKIDEYYEKLQDSKMEISSFILRNNIKNHLKISEITISYIDEHGIQQKETFDVQKFMKHVDEIEQHRILHVSNDDKVEATVVDMPEMIADHIQQKNTSSEIIISDKENKKEETKKEPSIKDLKGPNDPANKSLLGRIADKLANKDAK